MSKKIEYASKGILCINSMMWEGCLLKCAEIISEVRSICQGKCLHGDVFDILNHHGCIYLASKIPKHREQLIIEYTLISAATNIRYHMCKSIFKQLEEKGIPYAVIKGAVLSIKAYGEIGYRRSGDIDILISRKNIDYVKTILFSLGFNQGHIVANQIIPLTREEKIFQSSMTHQIAPYIKHTDNFMCPWVIVDINTDIMWGENPSKIDMDSFLENTKEYSICGIKICKLKTEAEFISLCLHHYKDANSLYLLHNGNYKLSLFSDIYFYMKNNKMEFKILHKLCMEL